MDLLEVGKIVNTHGLRGEVKVVPWTDYPEVFQEVQALTCAGRCEPNGAARVYCSADSAVYKRLRWACLPYLSLDQPMIRPGILRLYSSRVAK